MRSRGDIAGSPSSVERLSQHGRGHAHPECCCGQQVLWHVHPQVVQVTSRSRFLPVAPEKPKVSVGIDPAVKRESTTRRVSWSQCSFGAVRRIRAMRRWHSKSLSIRSVSVIGIYRQLARPYQRLIAERAAYAIGISERQQFHSRACR